MGWYTESRRDLHPFVWLYSLLFVLNIQTVYTDDGILEARALPWYAGMRIDLKCTIYPTACKGAGDRPEQTIFKNSLSSFCAVAVTANCLDKPLGDMENPPGKCWCVKDAQTNFTTYVYRFFADPSLHNGTWTCVKGCYVNGAITPTDLTINNAAGASKTVQGKPEPERKCNPGIKEAVVEPERAQSFCYGQGLFYGGNDDETTIWGTGLFASIYIVLKHPSTTTTTTTTTTTPATTTTPGNLTNVPPEMIKTIVCDAAQKATQATQSNYSYGEKLFLGWVLALCKSDEGGSTLWGLFGLLGLLVFPGCYGGMRYERWKQNKKPDGGPSNIQNALTINTPGDGPGNGGKGGKSSANGKPKKKKRTKPLEEDGELTSSSPGSAAEDGTPSTGTVTMDRSLPRPSVTHHQGVRVVPLPSVERNSYVADTPRRLPPLVQPEHKT